MSKAVVLGLVFASGCAMGGKPDRVGVSDAEISTFEDAPEQHGQGDAAGGHVFMDAPGPCTPQQLELLQNPSFDLAPAGVNWTAVPIEAAYPIVTDDTAPIAAQSAPYLAWMGGWVADAQGQHKTDTMYQDVAVPAGATALVLTGVYYVGTQETGGTVYDSGSLSLRTTGGTVIEAVQSFDNAHAAGTWTPINHTFTNVSAGQTVRVFFTTSNDYSKVTTFMFDSLSLKATACP